MAKKITKCAKHPKYRAIRAPMTNCAACWDQYGAVQVESGKLEAKILKLVKKIDVNGIRFGNSDEKFMRDLVEMEKQRRNLNK
jgi:hypothetical protein